VITAYRPDAVIDFEDERFGRAFERFGEVCGQDVTTWKGYLEGHRLRRAAFIEAGATSSDHGHPTAATADLSEVEAEALFQSLLKGEVTPAKAELFRAQMLTEMARMSLDDGLVMQIHPGSHRNHNVGLLASHGRDKGADIPMRTEYVDALKPLLTRFGNDPRLSIILFTLGRDGLQPRAGPAGRPLSGAEAGSVLVVPRQPRGHDAVPRAGHRDRRLLQHRRLQRRHPRLPVDPGPPRRGPPRRLAFLARMVAEHRMDEVEAAELIVDLTYTLPKRAYKLDQRPDWAKPANTARHAAE
jgi:glucuronate isomerase